MLDFHLGQDVATQSDGGLVPPDHVVPVLLGAPLLHLPGQSTPPPRDDVRVRSADEIYLKYSRLKEFLVEVLKREAGRVELHHQYQYSHERKRSWEMTRQTFGKFQIQHFYILKDGYSGNFSIGNYDEQNLH